MSELNIRLHNIQVIANLEVNERLQVDKKGRLKVATGLSKLVGSIIKNIPKETEQATVDLAKRDFEKIEFGTDEYINFQKRLSALHIVSQGKQEEIAFIWYDRRFQNLVESGVKDRVAEAIVTAEICEDKSISEASKAPLLPEATEGGTSGSYFLKNRAGKKIGVFKPQDEEIFMPNNPRGHEAKYFEERLGPRSGHIQGTSFLKEIAAYSIAKGLFDHVPLTTKLEIPFRQKPNSDSVIHKRGSFQAFAEGEPIEVLKTEQIRDMPVKEVQKMALFDLMVGNSDRNMGNALYDSNEGVLTPIDHGLVFLDSLDWMGGFPISELNCQWVVWPQVRVPLDSELRESFLNYDLEKKCQDLGALEISEGSIREHKIRIIFLREALAKDLTLAKIAQLCTQTEEDSDRPNFLEAIVREVMYSLLDEDLASDEEEFFRRFIEIIKQKL